MMSVRIGGLFAARIRRYAMRSGSLSKRNSYSSIASTTLSRRSSPYHFENSGP
jgi:hypothetical protein